MSVATRYFVPVTLKTVTETSYLGGVSKTYAESTIQAYVSQINDTGEIDRKRAGGMGLVGTHIIMYPTSVTLHLNDRILFNSKEFIVKSRPMNPANKNHHMFAYLEEVA